MKTHQIRTVVPGLLVASALWTATACQGNEAVAPAEPPATTQGPDIFFAETSHDFGVVQQGAVLEHLFELRNRGNAPLELSKPSGS